MLKQVVNLDKSLFLRYLPLNMILLTLGKQKHSVSDYRTDFLRIYQEQECKSATIIWSKEMRNYLKEEIMKNQSRLVIELFKYFFKHGGSVI